MIDGFGRYRIWRGSAPEHFVSERQRVKNETKNRGRETRLRVIIRAALTTIKTHTCIHATLCASRSHTASHLGLRHLFKYGM